MTPSVLSLTLWVLAALLSANAAKNPGSYAPKTNQQCPETLLRQPPALNQTLSTSEVRYLAERRKLFPDAWRDWLGDGSNLGYDLAALGITANNGSGLPVIGIAASGGGYRCVSMRTHAKTKKALIVSHAVHPKMALVPFLALIHAIQLQRRRAQADCCKCLATWRASVAEAGSFHQCSSTTSPRCTIL